MYGTVQPPLILMHVFSPGKNWSLIAKLMILRYLRIMHRGTKHFRCFRLASMISLLCHGFSAAPSPGRPPPSFFPPQKLPSIVSPPHIGLHKLPPQKPQKNIKFPIPHLAPFQHCSFPLIRIITSRGQNPGISATCQPQHHSTKLTGCIPKYVTKHVSLSYPHLQNHLYPVLLLYFISWIPCGSHRNVRPQHCPCPHLSSICAPGMLWPNVGNQLLYPQSFGISLSFPYQVDICLSGVQIPMPGLNGQHSIFFREKLSSTSTSTLPPPASNPSHSPSFFTSNPCTPPLIPPNPTFPISPFLCYSSFYIPENILWGYLHVLYYLLYMWYHLLCHPPLLPRRCCQADPVLSVCIVHLHLS